MDPPIGEAPSVCNREGTPPTNRTQSLGMNQDHYRLLHWKLGSETQAVVHNEEFEDFEDTDSALDATLGIAPVDGEIPFPDLTDEIVQLILWVPEDDDSEGEGEGEHALSLLRPQLEVATVTTIETRGSTPSFSNREHRSPSQYVASQHVCAGCSDQSARNRETPGTQRPTRSSETQRPSNSQSLHTSNPSPGEGTFTRIVALPVQD